MGNEKTPVLPVSSHNRILEACVMAMLVLQSRSDHLQWIGDGRRAHLTDHREVEDVLERDLRVTCEVGPLHVPALELLVDRELNRTMRHVQQTRHEATVET